VSRALVAVVGPTCTGKTSLAVAMAHRLGSAELLNADSRQLRRGLSVGTCAPTAAELDGVPCHLLDLAEPGEPFTVADWLEAATGALRELEHRGRVPIVVGGTGLYVNALVGGFDFGHAPPDPERRAARSAVAATPAGLATLAAELRERDPAAAADIDLRNPRRVVRALEILDVRGVPLGVARRAQERPAVLIGVDADAALHERWIRDRVAGMFASGALLDETRAALRRGMTAPVLAGCGIGYAEAIDVLGGRTTSEAAAEATVRRTVRYAKAQRRFFRRDRRTHWLRRAGETPAELVDSALALLEQEAATAR
jgi:tRNA dimethylallyltransferase